MVAWSLRKQMLATTPMRSLAKMPSDKEASDGNNEVGLLFVTKKWKTPCISGLLGTPA